MGSPPGFVLIDEGWQQLAANSDDESGKNLMISFEADPLRFPGKIKGLVDDLHTLGIKHVGVWHDMMGYREGVHPQLAQKYDLPSDHAGRLFFQDMI